MGPMGPMGPMGGRGGVTRLGGGICFGRSGC